MLCYKTQDKVIKAFKIVTAEHINRAFLSAEPFDSPGHMRMRQALVLTQVIYHCIISAKL
jgi:hypothetical protein